MNITPIRTKADYKAALATIESLMSAKANTAEDDRLDVLVTLVEAYERAHFPMDLPDAVDAIKFRMEQSGLTPSDLQPVIGRLNRVYEVLSRKHRQGAAASLPGPENGAIVRPHDSLPSRAPNQPSPSR